MRNSLWPVGENNRSNVLRTRTPDRSKIKLESAAEARSWARHLRISLKELEALVEKVGDSPAAVRRELDDKQR